jgi:hypothetical protein
MPIYALSFIQSIVPNNSSLFLEYIHTFSSWLLPFHYFLDSGLLLIIRICDHILIIIVRKTYIDSEFIFYFLFSHQYVIAFFTHN